VRHGRLRTRATPPGDPRRAAGPGATPRRAGVARAAGPSAPLPSSRTARRAQVRNLGQPVELAQRYFAEGADEVTFLNITGFRDFPLSDLPMLEARAGAARLVSPVETCPLYGEKFL